MGNPDTPLEKKTIEKKTLFRRPPGQGDMRSEVFKLLYGANGGVDLDGLRLKIQAAPNQVFMILLDLYKENRVSIESLDLIIEQCVSVSIMHQNQDAFLSLLGGYKDIKKTTECIQKRVSEIEKRPF